MAPLVYLSSYKISMAFFVVLLGAPFIRAQDQSGFISIDCGALAGVNYTELTTGINYISDTDFINTGVGKTIVSELRNKYPRQTWRVRSFPKQKRNCYKINITRGFKYLIRTGFLYGNYDGLNILPQFDLLLGANRWLTVTIQNVSSAQTNEIIYIPSLDHIHICLVNTGHGTPFISYIELRTLKDDIYVTQFGSLETYFRADLGSNITYRYKDDVYDRLWNTYSNKELTQSSALIVPNSLDHNNNDYNLPVIVMSTAATLVNASAPFIISWQPQNKSEQFYVYMHFMEIQVLANNQKRQFSIMCNGEPVIQNFSPQYHAVNTFYSSSSSISGKEIKYSLEKTQNSTLPPIINAIEIYKLINFQQSDTNQGDVDAITTIKSIYSLTRNWQGDPCGPSDYIWYGLNCTYDKDISTRIIILNLSSSGLSGKIDSSISNLTMLEKLDLSNNNLNGELPDFLSQLQHLKILNLDNNNLSGSIPSALVEKFEEGSLLLSVDKNPYLCESGQCNKNNKNNIIMFLVASICTVWILLAAVTTILYLNEMRKSKASLLEKDQSEISMEFKKQIYSYSDVVKITNNFNTIIGKGGFGIVYLGYIDDIQVAVKMFSPSSVHGYQQFQAEVKLLMRVHHINLTSLIGYCNEGVNKSLIYEYMANGNLQEHLSGQNNKSKFLSWEDRLRITLDAALGLEYLHSGCKPPIIHRDIKSTNILLNEHFQAKLSDFGLSKVIPIDGESHVSSVIAGTPGYLDPDYYISNILTEKSDIYSFGVVLLEIITSQPLLSTNQERTHIIQRVRSLIKTGDIETIVDSRLAGDFDINSAWKAIEIAMSCISLNPNKRPSMSVIIIELKETLATELARTKRNSSLDSIYIDESDNVNLDTKFIPLAR